MKKSDVRMILVIAVLMSFIAGSVGMRILMMVLPTNSGSVISTGSNVDME